MRSNPFATSFGKKTEERRGDPASPQPGYGRFARVQEASRAMPPRDGMRRSPPPAPRREGQATASRDAPVDADTLATLRSWGLPDVMRLLRSAVRSTARRRIPRMPASPLPRWQRPMTI